MRMKKVTVICLCMFLFLGTIASAPQQFLAAEPSERAGIQALLGDLNGDGVITIEDAQAVLKMVLHMTEADFELKYTADVNEDSKVNLEDVQLILKKALRIINDYDDIIVKSVKLSPNSATLDIGKTLQLSAEVLPESAKDLPIVWRTSNPMVATVSNGVVKGVSPGNVTIRATVGDKSAECMITVATPGRVAYYSGSGNKVIQGVNLPLGLYKVRMTNNSKNGLFNIWVYNGDGTRSYLWSNVIGSYKGSRIFNESLSNGLLQVNSTGQWTIEVCKITEQGTSKLSGNGDSVSPFFYLNTSSPIVVNWKNYTSKGLFAIILYDEYGRYIGLIANEIGTSSGQQIIVPQPGVRYCIEVMAEGKWEVDFGLDSTVTVVPN